MASSAKPIMLLDVDGPLNPYAAKVTKRPEGFTTHRMRPTGWEDPGLKPLRVWLDHSMGAKLKSLGYQIVWATAWKDDANKWISPHIGLPEDLEVIEWGPHETKLLKQDYGKLFYKTTQIASWMTANYPDRDFIWVDDEAFDRDENFLKEHCDGKVKVFTIDPSTGITDKDLGKMADWKAELNG